MAWEPDYATVEELADYVRIPDAMDDAVLALAVTAASRAIDQSCGRQFGTVTGERVYEADGSGIVSLDDLTAVTAVTVDGTAVTDYTLTPRNAAVDGKPYTALRVTAVAGSEVAVTGTWGWAAVPTAVKTGCLMQASRFLARRDSPYGIAGSPEAGAEVRLLARVDPDVEVILRPYRRIWGAV